MTIKTPKMVSLIVTVLFALVATTVGKSLDPFIIGGVEASVGAWPWQGSLQYINGGHTCGCSLISQEWIITAAHCVGAGANSLMVYMGLHDRFDSSVGNPKGYYISQIIKHQAFDNGEYFLHHDIALIKVNGRVELNTYVKTVPLAPQGSDFDDQQCYITGWGITTEGGGSMARRLRQAEVPVISQSTCGQYWRLSNGQICVGVKGQKGSCNGDSGGPLVCMLNGEYHLAGLTSYGLIKCYTSKPSVYTRVSYYRQWVTYHTGI